MAANEHKELTLSSPEIVERVAQAEREFSVYQEQKGAFVSEKARDSARNLIKNAEKMEPASRFLVVHVWPSPNAYRSCRALHRASWLSQPLQVRLSATGLFMAESTPHRRLA